MNALVRQGDWGVDSGYRAAMELMAMAERPTAIFAGNDIMAMGAMYAFQESGVKIPQDVAIVGYDDRDFAAWLRPAADHGAHAVL